MRALRKTMTDVNQKLGSKISDLKTKLVESDAERRLADAKRVEAATKRDDAVTELSNQIKLSSAKSDRIEEMLEQLLGQKKEEEQNDTKEEGGEA